jgi:3-dehydroquinate dehydratase/shikimate dehydrogenase
MICVTLGRGRHSALIAEWKEAAEEGAELVELRIDCLRREPDLKRILKERFTPVVVTVRRGSDGGIFRGDEEKRQRILREAIVMGVDMVDLEIDIADKIPRFGKTKRIISYHNFKRNPSDLADILEKARGLAADYVKFAVPAPTLDDACLVLEAIKESSAKVPTIGVGMGDSAQFTRILNRKYGSAMTYAGFNPERTFAPGMPQFFDLKDDYFYDQINTETEVYAVIGDPIGHSLSPPVHNAAFRNLEMNKVMVPIRIPAGKLKESIGGLRRLGVKGMSVTIPHKESMMELLTEADRAVDMTGACNTVVFRDGKLLGHNTDYHAAMDSLEYAFGGRTDPDVSPLLDKQILILGAGGVARTLAFGLSRRGAGVTICARDDEKGAKLASEVGCRSTSWGMRAATLVDAMINCTPVGMHPDVDSTPVPPAGFRPGMVVFDVVYRPENTMFLKLARDRECVTVTGVEMFIQQAAKQFELYTGMPAPLETMRSTFRRKIGAAQL